MAITASQPSYITSGRMTDNAIVLAKMAARAKEAFHSGERSVYIYNEPDNRAFEIDCGEVDIDLATADEVDVNEIFRRKNETKQAVAAHIIALIDSAIVSLGEHYLVVPVDSGFEPDQWCVKIQFTVGCVIGQDRQIIWLSLWFGISQLDVTKLTATSDDW